MLKKISLRARLTLLSALVMVSVALTLTAMFFFGADQIFVQKLKRDLVTFQAANHYDPDDGAVSTEKSKSASVEIAESEARGGFYLTPKQGDLEAGKTDYTIAITLSQAGRRFNLWGLAALFPVLFLGIAATWFIAGRALRPLRDLSDTIEEIGGNDLFRRVDACGRQDEIGHLANSFNGMMDKLSDSFQRQKQFSANAAHELRTPLATIQVGLDVLELDERPTPQRLEKAVAVAKANTARMIRLVNDLFAFSSDAVRDLLDEIPVHTLFDEIVAELSPLLQTKNLTADASAPPEIRLRGNRTMLYRALFNLAENAAKYNRDGGSISLSAACMEEEIVICVSDTGIGIPPEALEHIFEPFYRVDRSRSRALGGSGLGLALVRDIVETHSGHIDVKSEPGSGSIFTLRFPMGTTPED